MKNSPLAFPTIASIAAAAGVSAMTVSRALKGNTRHSAETRERIQRIAKELGYRPNPLVSALMSARAKSSGAGTTANLAVLRLGQAGRVVIQGENPPLPDEFLTGIYDQARNQGYAIELFDLEEVHMSPAQLRRVFINRGIRGIILMPAPHAPFHLDFDLEGFAVSAIGFSVANERLPRVSSDAYLRTLDGIRGLASRGYKRIGVLNVPDMDRRFNFGMSAAAEIANSVIPGVTVTRCMLSIDPASRFDPASSKAMIEWIKSNQIEAVMSQMDDTFAALRREGYKIGKDLAYLHLHQHPNKQVACMDQMFATIGKKAVDMVGAMINRNEFTLPELASVVNIPSVWRDGLSVPDRSPKNKGKKGREKLPA